MLLKSKRDDAPTRASVTKPKKGIRVPPASTITPLSPAPQTRPSAALHDQIFALLFVPARQILLVVHGLRTLLLATQILLPTTLLGPLPSRAADIDWSDQLICPTLAASGADQTRAPVETGLRNDPHAQVPLKITDPTGSETIQIFEGNLPFTADHPASQELGKRLKARLKTKEGRNKHAKIITNQTTENGNFGATFAKRDQDGSKVLFTPPVNGILALPEQITEAHREATEPLMRASQFLAQRYISTKEMPTLLKDWMEIRAAIQSTSQLGSRPTRQLEARQRALRQKIARIFQLKIAPSEAQNSKGVLSEYQVDMFITDLAENQRIQNLNALCGKFDDPSSVPLINIGGMDWLITRLDKVLARATEANLQTPSGASNNFNVAEIIRRHDPELYAVLAPYIDNSVAPLKEILQEIGRRFTNSRTGEGITVILGAGEASGAYPDFAGISQIFGIPLVRHDDLYEGKDGNVYLNTGAGRTHPRVISIYSRVDTGSLLSNQNAQIGFTLESELYQKNPEWEKDLKAKGLLGKNQHLKPGVAYAFQTEVVDGETIVTGIRTDSDGSPILMESIYQMGPDPKDPRRRGSFFSSFINRKVYITNVMGNAFDSKRMFELLSIIALNHVRPESNYRGVIAGPPKTFRKQELAEKLSPSVAKNLRISFVRTIVEKINNGSSGKGITIGQTLNEAQALEVADRIYQDVTTRDVPEYTVQDFLLALGIPTVIDGEEIHLLQDLRTYYVLDADGRLIDIGDLGRNAPPYSAKSNTGAGGAYGWVARIKKTLQNRVALDAPAQVRAVDRAPLVTPLQTQLNLRTFMVEFMKASKELTTGRNRLFDFYTAPHPWNWMSDMQGANHLDVLRMRFLNTLEAFPLTRLSYFGEELQRISAASKSGASKATLLSKLRTLFSKFARELSSERNYPYDQAQAIVLSILEDRASYRPNKTPTAMRGAHTRPLNTPIPVDEVGPDTRHVLLSRLQGHTDPALRGLLKDLEREGVAVFHAKVRAIGSQKNQDTLFGANLLHLNPAVPADANIRKSVAEQLGISEPDFVVRVDLDLDPVQLQAGLAHELTHAKRIRNFQRSLLSFAHKPVSPFDAGIFFDQTTKDVSHWTAADRRALRDSFVRKIIQFARAPTATSSLALSRELFLLPAVQVREEVYAIQAEAMAYLAAGETGHALVNSAANDHVFSKNYPFVVGIKAALERFTGSVSIPGLQEQICQSISRMLSGAISQGLRLRNESLQSMTRQALQAKEAGNPTSSIELSGAATSMAKDSLYHLLFALYPGPVEDLARRGHLNHFNVCYEREIRSRLEKASAQDPASTATQFMQREMLFIRSSLSLP